MNGLSQRQYDEIKIDLESIIGRDSCRVLRFVKDKYCIEYSATWAQKMLHDLGYSYKQLCVFPVRTDVQAQLEFHDKYLDLMSELSDHEVGMFLDAAHPQHNTAPSKAWIAEGQERHIPTNNG